MKKSLLGMSALALATAATVVCPLPAAHADETWLALTVNSTNSKSQTVAYWRTASTAEAGWAQGMADCKAEFGSDGTCEEATSSRRCIGLALGNGANYYTAWADTAPAAFAAAQAKSPTGTSSKGRGKCADGTATS